MCLPVIWTLSLIFQHLVTFTLVTLAALVFQLARRTDSMMKPAPYRVLATGALEQEVRPWFVAVFHVIVFEWRVVGTDTRLFHWLSAFLNATLAKWDVPFEKLGVNSEHYVQKYCRMFKIPQEPWVWAKPASEYLTMNDWFARKYAAPFDPESNLGSAFISSPSTSVVMWFASVAAMPRLVKNERFTIDESGIPNHEEYLAYPCAIMYLAPADYHCYHSPIDGIVRSCDLLGTDGYSVTVKPYIFEHINILARNRRAVIVVESDAGLSGKTSFRVALVIVGGVTVDSIRLEEATRVGARVFRGQLLGCFARGGSAVAMFFNRDVALADSCAAVRSEGLDFKIDVGRDLANLA
jgi:phosphatidylserine decarboxylase